MKIREIDVGIYRLKLTVYRTGNLYVCFVNRVSGEERTIKVRNPLDSDRKLSSISYRI